MSVNLNFPNIVGTDTSDATATASDIAVGKTAYVNGVKVIGTKEDTVQDVVWVDNVSGSLESVYASNRYYSTLSDFIKEITIPNGVTGIGNYAFKNCSSLESVTIPESVKSIGFDAFQYCSSLTSITIPVSITDINQYAFADCTNLANIYYKGTEEQWNSITKGIRWNLNMGRNVSGGTVIHYNS